MASSSSSSSKRKLGLEEAGGEGKVGKRALSDSVSSSSEEEDNKLYVFVSHMGGINYVYTLFALSIPKNGSIVKIRTSTLNPKLVKGIRDPISSILEPKRSLVTPVLRFPANEGWPNDMRCIGLGRKLYFLGGVNKELIPSPQVHVLDLSQQEMVEDDPTKALKPVASMDTGKSCLFVSFVADGKIFVVCGKKQCSFTRVPLTRFEIFCPTTGVWNVPDLQPPFPDAYLLYSPIVLDRTVFFAGDIIGGKFTCRYNIDTEIWTDYCRVDYFSPSVEDIVRLDGGVGRGGGEVVGETLWNVCDHPKTEMPVLARVDLAPVIGKKRLPKNKKFFDDVLRYCIPDQLDVDGRGTIEPAVRLLARLAEDSRRPNSSRLCFLQLEPINGLVGGQTRISAILFDVHGKGAGSAEYVTSAHYFFRNDSQNNYYMLTDAHLV